MSKLKKRIIALSIVVASVLIVAITLCFTLFAVHEIRVEFATTTNVLKGEERSIIEAGELKMNSCIFFQWKSDQAKRIEKVFPYARVINIESVAPWTLVIHVAEREEYYEFEEAGKLIVTDQTLKVLRVENSIPSETKNIRVKGVSILTSDKQPGATLQTSANFIRNIASALFENNRLIYEQKGMFASFEIGVRREPTTKRDELFVRLVDRGGFEVVVYHAEHKLTEKIQKMLASVPTISLEDRGTKYIEIGDLFDGGIYWLDKVKT